MNDAVFSPDGGMVLTASDDRQATLWNAESSEVLGNLTGHTDRVRAAAFSTHGDRAVTASSDKTARIWDIASRETLQVLEGHDLGRVVSPSFPATGGKSSPAARTIRPAFGTPKPARSCWPCRGIRPASIGSLFRPTANAP